MYISSSLPWCWFLYIGLVMNLGEGSLFWIETSPLKSYNRCFSWEKVHLWHTEKKSLMLNNDFSAKGIVFLSQVCDFLNLLSKSAYLCFCSSFLVIIVLNESIYLDPVAALLWFLNTKLKHEWSDVQYSGIWECKIFVCISLNFTC